ncbi:MAG: UDP-glucose 4-epimerase GalE [Clostridia bacterium]|nr:UDP-glucose 4-epimerase GalE [Clostridia bacterium]
MKVLVTGGAGYIGSHTCVALLEAGYDVACIDNLDNSSYEAIRRVEELTGKKIPFYEKNVLDRDALKAVFEAEKPEAVIHFAALKAVGESVAKPLEYYHTNVFGTITLLEIMRECGVKKLVYSSSATVYSSVKEMPVNETSFAYVTTNPYGWTKIMCEQIIRDTAKADPELSVALLRYFNPVGAHPSGRIGEDPAGIPNNLMPYIAQVAAGKLQRLSVYGNDYPTRDGTGVRDYIHVCDLADGHVLALGKIAGEKGVHTWNLGSGKGTSVLEMVKAFEKASGKKIPYVIAPRRPGDIAEVYADASLAEKELGFKTRRDVFDMCRDLWNWQSQNPNGYGK